MMQIPSLDEFVTRFEDPAWMQVGRELLTGSGVTFSTVTRAPHGESIVMLADDRYVLKIYRPGKQGFKRETSALQSLHGKLPVPIPDIISAGQLYGYDYLITTAVGGRAIARADWLKLARHSQIEFIDHLAELFRTLHSLDVTDIRFDWQSFIAANTAGAVERQRQEGGNPEWITSLPSYIECNFPLVQTVAPHAFLHGDVHFGNLMVVEEKGRLKIAGLFDFADSLCGSHEYDFLAPGVLMFQGQGELQREFFRRYGYADADLDEEMRRRMMTLTLLYEFSSLRRYAERLSPEAVNLTLEELERAIWRFA